MLKIHEKTIPNKDLCYSLSSDAPKRFPRRPNLQVLMTKLAFGRVLLQPKQLLFFSTNPPSVKAALEETLLIAGSQ